MSTQQTTVTDHSGGDGVTVVVVDKEPLGSTKDDIELYNGE